MKFLFLALVFGCVRKEKEPLSANEIKYLDSLDIESRVYIEDCMKNVAHIPTWCISQMRELGKKAPADNSNSVLKTAAGVAIGYGAAKVIMGK